MDLHTILYAFKHLDETIDTLTRTYGSTTYFLLGLVVFCETGLVVLPFLPGDSLLFAIGAIGMRDNSGLNPVIAGAILVCAALLGDNVNYQVGRAIGPRVMKSETSRIFNKKHLDKTHAFFEKYGGKTIILARFVPIVRTFAPFVAGAGAMTRKRFLSYSVFGALLWVSTMVGAGMAFGQLDFVKKHFEAVVVGIVVLSVMPMVVEALKARRQHGIDPVSTPAKLD
jgi:membrane-associated protein